MGSERDIKRRIKSVKSTSQITKAMNLVAASKLQKARINFFDAKPFMEETRRIISEIVNYSLYVKHPLIDEREVKKSVLIVISGDKGFCGGYNANINKAAFNYIKQHPNTEVIPIGLKAKDYFSRRNVNIHESFWGMSESPGYMDARIIAHNQIDRFRKGEIDELLMAYSIYKSTITHEPVVLRLLPVSPASLLSEEQMETRRTKMNYEPNEEVVLDYVIPKFVSTLLYGALLESGTCELGARMTAMDSATDNAEELIEDLTLLCNRARQGAITQEINEIVAGANALK